MGERFKVFAGGWDWVRVSRSIFLVTRGGWKYFMAG